MVYIIVHSKVEDYAKWRSVFDENAEVRKANGATGNNRVFRSVDDPNALAVILEWENTEKAKQFAESDEIKAAMQKAGVAGKPDIHFVDEV